MDGLRYDTDIDLANPNNSHTLMVELIGGSKRVLDVGCATGYLARALRDRDCSVSGLEFDPVAAEEARPHLDTLVVGNAEEIDLLEAFGEQRFDVVVFGDVLEHLRDPLAVLRSARRLLDDGGSVVASIPNVAHGSLRLALMAGRFDYQPLGLLDSTHLRFFTRASGFFDTPLPVSEAEFPPEVVEAVLADPESSTYQFVLRAVNDDADAAVSRLHADAEALRSRVAGLERELAAALDAGRQATVRAEEAEKLVADLESRADATERDLDATLRQASASQEELQRMLATRTIRWSSTARSVYGRLRTLLSDA